MIYSIVVSELAVQAYEEEAIQEEERQEIVRRSERLKTTSKVVPHGDFDVLEEDYEAGASAHIYVYTYPNNYVCRVSVSRRIQRLCLESRAQALCVSVLQFLFHSVGYVISSLEISASSFQGRPYKLVLGMASRQKPQLGQFSVRHLSLVRPF